MRTKTKPAKTLRDEKKTREATWGGGRGAKRPRHRSHCFRFRFYCHFGFCFCFNLTIYPFERRITTVLNAFLQYFSLFRVLWGELGEGRRSGGRGIGRAEVSEGGGEKYSAMLVSGCT